MPHAWMNKKNRHRYCNTIRTAKHLPAYPYRKSHPHWRQTKPRSSEQLTTGTETLVPYPSAAIGLVVVGAVVASGEGAENMEAMKYTRIAPNTTPTPAIATAPQISADIILRMPCFGSCQTIRRK